MSTERVFKAEDRFGAEIEFELFRPGLAEEAEGERQYRIAFSKALTEGIFPREKMAEVMRHHMMWTDDDDKNMKAAIAKIAIMQIELEQAQTAGKQDECIKLAKEISDQRNRMWELFLIQQSVYMNSAEGVAEAIKAEAIMAACTKIKATGERYWKSYSEFVSERDGNSKSRVYEKVVELQGKLLDEVREDLLNQYPERQYMQNVKDTLLDKDIEDEVSKELRRRAEKVIKNQDEKEKKKAPVRKKKVTKKVMARKKKS
jgi:hypothetical protein